MCHGPIGPGARLLEFPGGTPHAGSSMEEDAMQVLYSRCAGLDVHKDTVVASARLASGRDVSIEVRTFATTTAGLLALSAWLAERGCGTDAPIKVKRRLAPGGWFWGHGGGGRRSRAPRSA